MGENKKVDSGAYNASVDWFLCCSESALSERSNWGSFIAAMERGAVTTGGVPSTDLYSDQQVGWHHTVVGNVEKERQLARVWKALPQWAQAALLAQYVGDPGKVCSDVIATKIRNRWNGSEKERLAGLLVFLSWRIGRLANVIAYYESQKDQRGSKRFTEPPHYRKACRAISRAAHLAWSRAYQETTLGAWCRGAA